MSITKLRKEFEEKFGLDCLKLSYLGTGDVFDGENYTKLLWSFISKALKERRKADYKEGFHAYEEKAKKFIKHL